MYKEERWLLRVRKLTVFASESSQSSDIVTYSLVQQSWRDTEYATDTVRRMLRDPSNNGKMSPT
jgi:hypothetical protein